MDWPATFAELLAVVVGILLALWVNNWNQRRLARRVERDYLGSLRDDVATDVEALKQQLGFAEGTKLAATELLRIVRSSHADERPPNVVLRLLKRAGMMYPFQPTKTTLQELSGGGNLGVVRNRDLLRRVIAYYGSADFTANLNALAIRRIWYDYYDALTRCIDPSLIPRITADVFALLREGALALPDDVSAARPIAAIGMPDVHFDPSTLVDSTELERALALVLDSSVVVVESVQDLLRQAQGLHELLDASV